MGQGPQNIYGYFGDLLDYPGPDLVDQASACCAALTPDYAEEAEQVADFLEFAKQTPQGRLEELYTATFDLNPACYIFVGYMMFGESFKRGKFLVGLQERYKEHGFSAGDELADHLAVMFKFLATLSDTDVVAQELLADCLLPMLQRMNNNFKHDNENPNPYAQVLRAVLGVLERTQQCAPASA